MLDIMSDMKTEFPFDENSNLIGDINYKSNISLLILVHGFTMNRKISPIPEVEAIANKLDYSTLSIDLYGHGESDGLFKDITISKGISSISSAYKFAQSKGFINIGIFAESFGGQCAILSTNSCEFEFMILKSPVSDYLEVESKRRSDDVMQSWEKNGELKFINGFGEKKELNYSFYQDLSNHDSYKDSSEYLGNVLILHGELDPTVPVSQSKRLNDEYPNSELLSYASADHKIHLSDESEKMYNDIEKFLESTKSHQTKSKDKQD